MSETVEPTDTQPEGPLIAADGTRPLILVVDDVPANLTLLAEMLHREGADVRAANAGPVALRYAALAPRLIDLSADFYFREYGWCYIYTNRPEVPLWSFAREDKPFTGFCALFEDDGDVVPWDTVSFGG